MEHKRKHTGFWLGAVLLGVAGLSAGSFYAGADRPELELTTAAVTRGNVVETVNATGTLEAVTTVQVGAQVTGIVESLGADFNSIVREGQVLARLDPSVFESQAEQARANLAKAEAEAARLRVVLENAEATLARSATLVERQLISLTEHESAALARRSAESQVASADAAVAQARAALKQCALNLQKTVITAPINGIVISRSVDVGQTVSASLQAPTLFVLADKLEMMRVRANVDESDVARMAQGQPVRFQVDAFPNTDFAGTVAQVRLEPITEQNVVTYAVLIDVANPELKLRPGMTTMVTIEVARRDDILRVPIAALRFQPDEEALAALAGTDAVEAPGARGSGTAAATGRLWVADGPAFRQVSVRTGASDGAYTELLEGTAVAEGTEVLTAARMSGKKAESRPAVSSSPLLQGGPGFRPGMR